MEIKCLTFTLKEPLIAGSNVLLRFSQKKKPLERIMSVTDERGTTFYHIDVGMWVAICVAGGTGVININVFDCKGPVGMEIVQTEN